MPSIDPRNDLPWHPPAVLLPGRAVLPVAAPVIPSGSIHQQHGQIDYVKIRQEVAESGRQAPGQRQRDLRHIVEVPGHAPPTRRQQ